MEIAVASSRVAVCSEQKVQLRVLYMEQWDIVCFLTQWVMAGGKKSSFNSGFFTRKQLHLLLR